MEADSRSGRSKKELRSFFTYLKCLNCGAVYGKEEVYLCPRCGGFLDPKYDYEGIAEEFCIEDLPFRERSIWKWKEFMPVDEPISLGEGNTPLIRCERVSEEIGIRNLYLKDETVNPTGSLKDRSTSVNVSIAKELGVKTVAIISTGNAAASLAAYATRADLKAVVMVPEATPNAKIAQALVHGALVLKIRARSMAEFYELYEKACSEFGWMNSVGGVNPYRNEGKKTYAYELSEAFDWDPPDWFIMPMAGGNALIAAWKGFKELFSLGLISKASKLVGVQPKECAAIVKAFREGREVASPISPGKTIVTSLIVSNPGPKSALVLKAIRESNGTCDDPSDDEVLEAMKLLAKEGIFSEPGGAISLAAAKRLVDRGVIDPPDSVVCLITGSGFKDMKSVEKILKKPIHVDPTLESLEKALIW
ncbi:MAG TPA: threonine synthase [Candidatus Korarchaeota archaeon]|nr:threonine synthase [Candidatus Korarchaeota archaeon]